jgi:hypothetical protein
VSVDFDPADPDQPLKTEARNERILVILAVLSVGGSIAGAALLGARFGLGVLVGCVLAFVNYFWMRRSLRAIFSNATEGQRPSFVGAGYFIRYVVLGGIVAFFHVFGILPIAAVLVGMAGFGIAILFEAAFRGFRT